MSKVYVNSAFNIFEDRPIQTSVVRYNVITLEPQNVISYNAPIVFHYKGNADTYIDSSQTDLCLRCKIVGEDGKALSDTDKITLVNNPLNSLFQHIEVQVNGVTITPPQPGNPYRTYIEQLLNYSEDSQNTWLESSLWKKDTPGAFDNFEQNAGLKWRFQHTKASTEFELLGRLSCSLFSQEKYIPNNMDIVVKLTPSTPEFHLISVGELKGKTIITSATLYMTCIYPSASMLLAHHNALSKLNGKIPLDEVDVQPCNIPKGTLTIKFHDILVGKVPRRVTIAFVEDMAYNGNFNKNPYNFTHIDLSYFQLHVNDQPFPSQPLTPNFTDNKYVQAYNTIKKALNIDPEDRGHSISRSDYPKGYTIIMYDLTADNNANETFVSGLHHGNVSINLAVKNALPEPICMIVLSEYQRLMEFDINRSVFLS